MGAYKDKKGKWFASARYKNWQGETKRKMKRGFLTKHDALAWERDFIAKNSGSIEMTFTSFYELYKSNLENRLRPSTWYTKESIIEKKILPFFGNYRICDIKPLDVMNWQNSLPEYRDKNGDAYSPVYLKTMHNQLSAIFDHAKRFYGLHDNPASYYAFETLYWCGLRLGETLALTPADFDFELKIICVTKSFQRIGGKDIITPPKTDKGIRRVLMPDFYADKMKNYIDSLQLASDNERIFLFTKSYMHHEMRRGCASSGVKYIRIHGIRHSHISLLIDMGFNAVAIAERVGHESIDITYCCGDDFAVFLWKYK